MSKLSREEFVKICIKSISYTREKITILNQISGYSKYHKEQKENRYLLRMRQAMKLREENNLTYLHDFIGHAGVGNCKELAQFLLIEIAKRIHAKDACAKISIVKSTAVDHGYLRILIKLKNEKRLSYWEVDAWDPRIIDISRGKDGSINHFEALETYGYEVDERNSVRTNEIDYNPHFFSFRKPAPGAPEQPATPELEMRNKHKWLYDDYVIQNAIDAGAFDPQGKILELQKSLSY